MGIAEIIRTNDKEIRLLLDKAKPKISVINDVGTLVISALAGSNSDSAYNKIAAPANNRINCNLTVLPFFGRFQFRFLLEPMSDVSWEIFKGEFTVRQYLLLGETATWPLFLSTQPVSLEDFGPASTPHGQAATPTSSQPNASSKPTRLRAWHCHVGSGKHIFTIRHVAYPATSDFNRFHFLL